MVTKRENVNGAWAQVDVVLQRRADLIPNLVETVKGYAAQEVTVFGDVDKARAAYMGATTPADKIAANGALDTALDPHARDCRKLPAAQIEREFSVIAGRTRGHRESHSDRAPPL